MTKDKLNDIVDKYFADYPHMAFFENIDDHVDEVYGLNDI